eukprot:GHVS01089464.1.p1 GENE.GHVS01089464.1~~GHVS01089464.1.p1  ORF type:complete len:473 (+),score=41.32 GHVS01089464.1:78-1496(+)
MAQQRTPCLMTCLLSFLLFCISYINGDKHKSVTFLGGWPTLEHVFMPVQVIFPSILVQWDIPQKGYGPVDGWKKWTNKFNDVPNNRYPPIEGPSALFEEGLKGEIKALVGAAEDKWNIMLRPGVDEEMMMNCMELLVTEADKAQKNLFVWMDIGGYSAAYGSRYWMENNALSRDVVNANMTYKYFLLTTKYDQFRLQLRNGAYISGTIVNSSRVDGKENNMWKVLHQAMDTVNVQGRDAVSNEWTTSDMQFLIWAIRQPDLTGLSYDMESEMPSLRMDTELVIQYDGAIDIVLSVMGSEIPVKLPIRSCVQTIRLGVVAPYTISATYENKKPESIFEEVASRINAGVGFVGALIVKETAWIAQKHAYFELENVHEAVVRVNYTDPEAAEGQSLEFLIHSSEKKIFRVLLPEGLTIAGLDIRLVHETIFHRLKKNSRWWTSLFALRGLTSLVTMLGDETGHKYKVTRQSRRYP